MSARIGRVFFSKGVALPFTRWRMLRHGILSSDISWKEVNVEDTNGIRGILFQADPVSKPDIVVYYCHGGGFSMGSPYFYLEPSLTMVDLLKSHYKNPALFSLDYELVPDKQWPSQLKEVALGYDYVLSLVNGRADRVCCGGDSAGGTLTLTLLLSLARRGHGQALKPGYATLFSPWVTLVTDTNRDNSSDFLSVQALHKYALQYANGEINLNNPLVSPGHCKDTAWWTKAAPIHGFYFAFGSEEILAPEIKSLVKLLRSASVPISVREQKGCVHAWIIANLFLADTRGGRLFGMKEVVKAIAANIPPLDTKLELFC